MVDQLVYNFVSHEELYEMNNKFLSHSTHTDIITFNYTHDQSLRAEFFISQWAVERSAEEESHSMFVLAQISLADVRPIPVM